MFQALKSIALSLALSIPVAAQWGAVTQKDDYNRFINSTSKYGLIMSTQELVKERQDTTITSAGTASGGAHKIIAWDDRQALYNCVNFDPSNTDNPCHGSLPAAQIRESTLSMFQASRGDTALAFPVVGQAEISFGQDSLVIRNSLDGEIHSVYLKGSYGPLGNGDMEDLDYKDRNIYVATSTQLYRVDLLTDSIVRWGSDSEDRFQGNLQERNDGLGFYRTRAGGLEDQHTEAIAVVRDMFGLVDPFRGFSPAHWWRVMMTDATQAWTTYDPHDNAFTDRVATVPNGLDVAITQRGSVYYVHDAGTNDSFYACRSLYQDQDQGAYIAFTHAGSANKDLNWTSNGTASLAVIEGGQPIHNGDVMVMGSSNAAGGLYQVWPYMANEYVETMTARQLINSSFNAPREFYDAGFALAFEGNANDSSPNGYNFTANGTVAYADGCVFGKCMDLTGDSGGLSFTSHTPNWVNSSFYIKGWFKIASNPSGERYIVNMVDGNEHARVSMDSDGHLNFSVQDVNSTTDAASGITDFADNFWHHFALVRDSNANTLILYVDGIKHTNQDNDATGTLSLDNAYIGADNATPSNTFAGYIEDIAVGLGNFPPAAVAEEHAEGRRALNAPNLNLVGQSDDALYEDEVISVDVRDNMNGDIIVAMSTAQTAQLFNGRVLVDTFALNEDLKGAAFLPDYGQDSAAVVIWGATKTRMVRPAVTLTELAAFDWQAGAPKIVRDHVLVDSSGAGYFYDGNEAVDAGANAGVHHIKFADGTYGPFDIDQSGIRVEGTGWTANSGDRVAKIDGGILDDAIDVTADIATIHDIVLSTDAGIGNAYSCVASTSDAAYLTVTQVLCENADHEGIQLAGPYSRAESNQINNTDEQGVVVYDGGDWSHVLGNRMITTTHACIHIRDNADKIVINDNICDNSMTLNFVGSSADACIYDGNIFGASVTGTCSSCTAGSNEIY